MDPVQMSHRCPDAQARGRARLEHHRLRFVRDAAYASGVATVVPSESGVVWGVLWTLEPSHWQSLDEWEGFPLAYTLEERTVHTDDGSLHALVYVATSTTDRAPNKTYLDGILRGARMHGLPEEYVARLERLHSANP